MQWLDNIVDKWQTFKNKPRPGLDKVRKVFHKIGNFLSRLWKAVFMFRGLVLSAPVAAASVILAARSQSDLPEIVEITLPGIEVHGQNSLFGFLVYQTQYVPRGTAVLVPLILTVACLLLTMCSKRMFYPWIISLFTLTVPLFLLLTNVYL